MANPAKVKPMGIFTETDDKSGPAMGNDDNEGRTKKLYDKFVESFQPKKGDPFKDEEGNLIFQSVKVRGAKNQTCFTMSHSAKNV